MKRRIAFTLAAIMATTMLSACGGNAPSETQPQTSGTDSGTSSITSENSTSSADTTSSTPEATTSATTSETTTAAPEEPVVPEELPVLNVEPTLVMNGCMAFKCDGKNYVYNITDNEMYETEHDVSEIEVLKGNIAVFGNVSEDGLADTNAYIVNLKTGEQYANVKPFYNNGWNGDYLTVGVLTESFSGNTLSIGMLNSSGDWVLPLSDDYAICNADNIEKMSYAGQNDKAIRLGGIDAGSEYLYDIVNDKIIITIDIFNDTTGIDRITDEEIFINEFEYNNGTDSTYTIYHYDLSTDEKTLAIDAFPSVVIGLSKFNNNYVYYIDGIFKVYDINYNFITEYDLSSYNVHQNSSSMPLYYKNLFGANENAIVFNEKTDDGSVYTVVLSPNGDFICEPFKADNKTNVAYFSENKVILSGANDRIIDITTGEITEYDDSFEIVDYDTENNLMLVKTNGAYYLADPEAPDTLINPFERAKN